MDEQVSYSVVANGEIKAGFDRADVQHAFAALFNMPPEKAAKIVGARKIIKSNLDLAKAQAYQSKLEALGLGIELKEKSLPQMPVASGQIENDAEPTPAPQIPAQNPAAVTEMESEAEKPAFSLALEPTEEELRQARQEEEERVEQDSGMMVCPKCQHQQLKAEQCESCGVYMHKLQSLEEPLAETDATNRTTPPQTDTSDLQTTADKAEDSTTATQDDALNPKAILAACAAAILGAFLWKFIAIAFDYELGLVAWLIGGAVGFAAASLGSRGQVAGIVCGVLTVLSIVGGKYMTLSTIQQDWSSIIMEQMDNEELKYFYEEEQVVAQAYTELVTDDASMREFISGYGYSEAIEADNVTDEDVGYFSEFIAPRLESTALNQPSYEEWIQTGFVNELENISTWELMNESFGIIDVIFLVLGVATAYRLGSRETKA